MKITEEMQWQMVDLLDQGMTCEEVAETMNLHRNTVSKHSKLIHENFSYKDLQKYRWLKRYWKFTGRVLGNKYLGTHTKDGTRIVRKGEKGHLRTPYRTDFIFK